PRPGHHAGHVHGRRHGGRADVRAGGEGPDRSVDDRRTMSALRRRFTGAIASCRGAARRWRRPALAATVALAGLAGIWLRVGPLPPGLLDDSSRPSIDRKSTRL